MPVPVLLALLGAYQIGYAVNDWQEWYTEYVFTGSDMDVLDNEVDADMLVHYNNNYSIYETEDGVRHYVFHNVKKPEHWENKSAIGLFLFPKCS